MTMARGRASTEMHRLSESGVAPDRRWRDASRRRVGRLSDHRCLLGADPSRAHACTRERSVGVRKGSPFARQRQARSNGRRGGTRFRLPRRDADARQDEGRGRSAGWGECGSDAVGARMEGRSASSRSSAARGGLSAYCSRARCTSPTTMAPSRRLDQGRRTPLSPVTTRGSSATSPSSGSNLSPRLLRSTQRAEALE